MTEIEILQQQIDELRALIYKNDFSNLKIYTKPVQFNNGFTFAEGGTIKTGATTGTKIGATGDKIGLLGATPVARASVIGAPSIATVSGSGDDAHINSNFANVLNAINSIRTALANIGITS